jgi:hypothetical protein
MKQAKRKGTDTTAGTARVRKEVDRTGERTGKKYSLQYPKMYDTLPDTENKTDIAEQTEQRRILSCHH